ncbi:MAG: hypothetical protein K2H19_00085 [Ruminococcus sp.]|nr:hypothetical protein [Ruminococcus sp.]
MKKFKKFTAMTVSVALASTLFGCTPSYGSGSKSAMSIDGYDVPAGLFIYYSMQGYTEAANLLNEQNGTAPKLKDVKNSQIDSLDSTDWIQNKATDYCLDFVTIQKEFESIGGELAQEDIDEAEEMAAYYYAQDSRLDKNGVSLDTMEKMAQMTYMEQEVFDYYYGFEGSEGCSEEELKDYFDENFARVKYLEISLTDDEGNELGEDEQRELRKMAEKYVKQINAKSGGLNKMLEMEEVKNDYNEYVSAQTTTEEGETTTTTTTTTATTSADETTTTTTTNPYANERLLQKSTTTSAEESETGTMDTQTETVETDDEKNTRLFNEFVFNELPLNEAKIYDYSDDTIYVVIRGDLRERMTEDDYWTEDYISSLQSRRYYEDFIDLLETKSENLTIEKNSKAYRRYEPFKLQLETE